MKTFTKIALTALTALATLAPTANAKFQDQHGNTFYGPEDFGGKHAQIVEQLYNIGVPVVDGRGTNLCENENVLGWYTGEKNFMVICYGDYNLRAETLTHEAMHVAQDCRTGLKSNSLGEIEHRPHFERLANSLHQSKVDLITSQYDKEDWVLEVEAFYFETRPSEVSWFLSDTCGATYSL